MPVIRVPPNCTSITLATSGVLVPAFGLITVTQAEADSLISPYTSPNAESLVYSNANGTAQVKLPSVITSITLDGVAYVPSSGVISNVDATAYSNAVLGTRNQKPFFQFVSP